MDCGQPEMIPNSEQYMEQVPNTLSGDTVSFQCLDGFIHTDGDLTRTCQENATWSGQTGVCSSKYINILKSRALKV